MKNTFIVLFILFGASLTYSQKENGIRSTLIGVWQNSEGVGSGLTDNYQFFENGRFRFNYNEMDGTKRVVSYSGFWNVYKGLLHIHISRITIHLGGKWVKASGSSATEFEIEGGRIITKKISPVEKSVYSLSQFVLEDKTYITVTIGSEKYWKLSSDPKTYQH